MELSSEPLVAVDVHHTPLSVRLQVCRPRDAVAAPSALHASLEDRASLCGVAQWNFKKADFFLLYKLFGEIYWSEYYLNNDPNLAIKHFYEQLTKIIDRCVPKKQRSSVRSGYSYPE